MMSLTTLGQVSPYSRSLNLVNILWSFLYLSADILAIFWKFLSRSSSSLVALLASFRLLRVIPRSFRSFRARPLVVPYSSLGRSAIVLFLPFVLFIPHFTNVGARRTWRLVRSKTWKRISATSPHATANQRYFLHSNKADIAVTW